MFWNKKQPTQLLQPPTEQMVDVQVLRCVFVGKLQTQTFLAATPENIEAMKEIRDEIISKGTGWVTIKTEEGGLNKEVSVNRANVVFVELYSDKRPVNA